MHARQLKLLDQGTLCRRWMFARCRAGIRTRQDHVMDINTTSHTNRPHRMSAHAVRQTKSITQNVCTCGSPNQIDHTQCLHLRVAKPKRSHRMSALTSRKTCAMCPPYPRRMPVKSESSVLHTCSQDSNRSGVASKKVGPSSSGLQTIRATMIGFFHAEIYC